MNHELFNIILEARIVKMRSTLAAKAKEYSTEDRLHNLKVAARIVDSSPEAASFGMAVKHLVSILDMVNGTTLPNMTLIDEKIGDFINYMVLLEALFIERLVDSYET